DHFRMGMLGDLPDQGLAIALRHPVPRLDLLVRVDTLLKPPGLLGIMRFHRNAAIALRNVETLRIHRQSPCLVLLDTHYATNFPVRKHFLYHVESPACRGIHDSRGFPRQTVRFSA